jgi:osmotically-inducible protein OsmY
VNALAWRTYLPADAIKVKAEQGWITLSGEVEWDYQRESAKDAVRNLLGVVGVSDSITVKPSVSVGNVKFEIEAALKRRARNEAQGIFVAVNGSDVTLSGTAQSWSERELATDSAWATPGVSKVIDNIAISY